MGRSPGALLRSWLRRNGGPAVLAILYAAVLAAIVVWTVCQVDGGHVANY